MLSMEDLKQKSKYSISNIVAIIVFSVLALFAVVLVEEIIRCFIMKTESIFTENYIKNLIYLIISSLIYFFLFYFEQKNRLFCKEWLKISIILYVIITLNICNFFDLYTIRVVKYVTFVVNGAFFSIIGVSIYYNYLKNENNKVKAKAKMVVIFSVALALVFAFCTEIIWYLIDLVSNSEPLIFKYVLFDMLFALGGALIMNIFFYLSLIKTKKFINYCLIDIQK